MSFKLPLVALLIMTLSSCEMEAEGAGGFNPGAGGSGGFNPGTDSRPPHGDTASRPPAGIERARQVCLHEGDLRGTGVRILSEREIRGGIEIKVRLLTKVPPIKTQLLRCSYDYSTEQVTLR